MNQDILVSVVIPTYSRNTTLCKAIDSVINQTYKNLEIIVVDDNLADSEWRQSTEKLMEQYKKDSRVRYLKNKKNLGGSGARNEGIKASKGDYIAFLDDDDEYLPAKIEKQLECALTTDMTRLALVFCDVRMTYDDGSYMCDKESHYRGCCLYEAIRDNCLAATSQWLAVKSALLDVGMFTKVPCKQDSTLILKLLGAGYEVDYVPETLLQYSFYNIPRISSIGTKNIKGELLYREKCRKYYDRFDENQIREIEFLFDEKLYKLYKANNMKAKERKYFKRIIRRHPIRVGRSMITENVKAIKFLMHNRAIN